ncbi:disks large homolog 5-like [Peromyscus maniculatus bairdii]|uniref:disks large homolog 5-like n=1 Tax=Peromyscus maniculatus bairdii TaxID=230844 RepID=UPI003FD0BB18
MLTRLNRILGRQDGEHRETKGKQKEDGFQSPCHTPRNKWSWRKHRTTRKASSTPFFVTEQEQQLNQVEKLTLQLQMMTKERNELLEFLALYNNNELNNSTLYSQLLSEWTQLKENVSMLKEDNRKFQGEQILLQESSEEAKRLCEEAHEKIYDLWKKQQQHLLRKLRRLEEARDTLRHDILHSRFKASSKNATSFQL